MVKKIKSRRIFLWAMAGIFALVVGMVWRVNIPANRLSESEILALRDEYPICGVDAPEMVSMVEVQLETYIEDGSYDSFVYGEVLGDVDTFAKEVSTGHIELDEKFKNNGLGITESFYGYVISVIEDTEGRYQKGDKITIVDNVIFKDYNPTFSKGMKVIVPILENDASINREWFGVVGPIM